jgi:hypothetical protein
MPEWYEGLCSTCKYSSQCAVTKAPGQGVYSCEEYEAGDGSSHTGRRAKNCAGSTKSMGTDAKPHASSAVLGLCSNCIHRDTCRFPRPESGVWHCEEYE